MSKLVKTESKNWMPIDKFLEKIGKSKKELYNLVRSKKWWNGYVIKKPSGARKWEAGCYEDYIKWLET
ncbi:MAG: hypothetical protein E6Q32_05695 [Neisseriales bacterium]|nr:MAG: hypothetical protein E6Q32_05695 [Neisseriales bacterium]